MSAVRPFIQGGAEGTVVATAASSAGSTERLAAMFEANYKFIWRSLRRLGVPAAQIDDASQEVFVVATRRISDIEEGRERSFLFATAMRVAKDVHRSGARKKESGDEEAVSAAIDPRPSTDVLTEQKRARERLDCALERMPFELRAIFVMHEIEELSFSEIADALEIPRGTVASRFRRAKSSFFDALEQVSR